MSKIQKFEDLICWQESRSIVKDVFILCQKGELVKDFDTKSQLKRAALSTMNNIAEGFARYHKKEFIRFLDFSQSSAAEVKSMLYVLEDLKYINDEQVLSFHERTDKVRNLTLGLIRYLDKKGTMNTRTPEHNQTTP
jgi:four helix bundle protein